MYFQLITALEVKFSGSDLEFEEPAVMGSSKQMADNLKMELSDVYKVGKSYEKHSAPPNSDV